VRASSVRLDTGAMDKFPSATSKRCLFVRKRQQRRVVGQLPVRVLARQVDRLVSLSFCRPHDTHIRISFTTLQLAPGFSIIT